MQRGDVFWALGRAWEVVMDDSGNHPLHAEPVDNPHAERNLYYRVGPGAQPIEWGPPTDLKGRESEEQDMDTHDDESTPVATIHQHFGTQELSNDSVLTPEQDARAYALYQARGVLERRGGIGNVVTPPSRMDLLSVANWILTGSYRVEEG